MIRLLVFIPDLILVWIVYTQLARPLWRSQPIFPAVRRLKKALSSTVEASRSESFLLDKAKQRKATAELRLNAAKADLEAAQKEVEAVEIEDRTNNLRLR